MRKTLHILTILAFGTTYAQENKTSDCNLQLENELWKTEYETVESKAGRIELIKEKIKADSIYAEYEPKIKTAHGIINQHVDRKGSECGCKILFVLHYKKRKAIIINLNTRPEMSTILQKLNLENVESITHAFDESAQSLYGTSGKCGFVQLKITDRKLKRLIKNV